MKLVAVALVDREIYIYKVKKTGNKTGFVCIAQFRATLSKNSIISSICIEKYVKGQPILIVGTFHGDIRVYEIEIDPAFEFLSEKQKLEQRKDAKVMEGGAFNFFSKNSKHAETNFPLNAKSLSTTNKNATKVTIRRTTVGPSSDYHGPLALLHDENWNNLLDLGHKDEAVPRIAIESSSRDGEQ